MCECGREVYCQKTLECKRCYDRRNKRGAPAPTLYTALIPPTNPCSYDVAHQRVAQYRGSASTHTCTCGAQAEQWSYRNYSSYEIQGTKASRPGLILKWSSNVTDYDALCIRCHRIRDSKNFFDGGQRVPGVPPQNPSPIAGSTSQEAHNGL